MAVKDLKDLDEEVKEMLELFDAVEASKIPRVDGKVMACALELFFYAGVEKQEISSIKIRDLRWENSLPVGIDPGSLGLADNFIHLPDNAQKTLTAYLSSLRSQNGSINMNTPLFPAYSGPSGKKKFDRHLGKLSETLGVAETLQFGEIHKLGVKHHEDLFKKKQTKRTTASQFRITPASVEAIREDKTPPGGQPLTIDRKMDKVLDLVEKMDRSHNEYLSFMKGFAEQKNKDLEFILRQERSLDPQVMQRLKQKHIEVFRRHKTLYDPDLKLKSPSSKISSPSKVLFMVKAENERESIVQLMWFVDYITIMPVSDLEELNTFKDLFFGTLSKLVSDLQEKGKTEEAKKAEEAFTGFFFGNFHQRDIVFNTQTSSFYSSKISEDSTQPPTLGAAIKQFMESSAIGQPDTNLISFLKKQDSDDLKPLFSYLEGFCGIFSFYSYFFTLEYAGFADEIVERIQRVKEEEEVFQGIRRLASYEDVLHYVAEKLGANHSDDQPVDTLETEINVRIMKNLWDNLGEETQQALRALRVHEMNSMLARAFWKVHSGTDLPGHSGDTPFHWTGQMESEVCKELDSWLVQNPLSINQDFFAVLQCIVHISLLQQKPQPSETHVRYVDQLIPPGIGGNEKYSIKKFPIPKQAPSRVPSSGPILLPVIEDPATD